MYKIKAVLKPTVNALKAVHAFMHLHKYLLTTVGLTGVRLRVRRWHGCRRGI
jgi:hypothetical protein